MLPYLPTKSAINSGGPVTDVWLQYFLQELGQITDLTALINAVPGVNVFTIATQPALGPADAGYLGWLSDYKHQVRWTGAAWEFFGDSGNGFFADYAIVPQTGAWQLCDGTTTKYLTLGVTLTETSFTTPDLITTPAYKKSISSYTGTVNAKAGSTATGTSGSATPGITGNTDDESAHTHTGGTLTASLTFSGGIAQAGAGAGFTSSVTPNSNTVAGTSSAGSAHHHGVSALTVNAHTHSVPALGVGTIEMANLGVLSYFRR